MQAPHGDTKLAALGHCGPRIDGDVEQRIGQGTLVDDYDDRRGVDLRFNPDILAECPRQQGQFGLDPVLQVEGRGAERLLAGERQEHFRQVGSPSSRPEGTFDQPRHRRPVGDGGGGHLQIGLYDLKEIVEVVRDAACQLAHDLKLLCLAKLKLGGPLLGHVEGDRAEADDVSLAVLDREADVQFRPGVAAK